ENYLEVVAAPDYEDGAVEILKKRKNLRIVQVKRIDQIRKYRTERFFDFKCLLDGGIVVQQSPLNKISKPEDMPPAEITAKDGEKITSKRTPTEKEYEDLLFGWSVEQGVTSNSVIFVKDGVTVGIGTGEQDRVGVTEIAIFKAYKKCADQVAWKKHQMLYFQVELAVKAGELPESALSEINTEVKKNQGGLIGAVAVSDAFFPKRDAVDAIAAEGVTAIVQPGGSLGDKEIIQVCNESKPPIAMVFTGQRAFKH
ncbi:MAG: IMP cyclohydrolase, partial [Planctomycetes bacterium]|nr:IMP cyclohydrolase [Planctomycetota bacterium]